jgi:uncharacterized phage-associated protein
LEEASVKKFGTPFFGIDFQLWKLGPVSKDIYIELSDETPVLLGEYIIRDAYDNTLFTAATSFNDDEFSDNDIYLMDKIAAFAKHKSAKDLVEHTHSENSLWRKSALKNGVLEKLESSTVNSTDNIIDFSLLFDDNDYLKERYASAMENLEFVKHIKP